MLHETRAITQTGGESGAAQPRPDLCFVGIGGPPTITHLARPYSPRHAGTDLVPGHPLRAHSLQPHQCRPFRARRPTHQNLPHWCGALGSTSLPRPPKQQLKDPLPPTQPRTPPLSLATQRIKTCICANKAPWKHTETEPLGKQNIGFSHQTLPRGFIVMRLRLLLLVGGAGPEQELVGL